MMRAWIVLAAVCAAMGCGGSQDNKAGGTGGSAGVAGSGGSGGSDAGTGGTAGSGGSGGSGGVGGMPADEHDTGWTPEPPSMLDLPMDEPARPDSCGPEHRFVAGIRGWAVAPGGKALPSVLAYTCLTPVVGERQCLNPTEAGGAGVYTTTIPENLRCLDEVTMRIQLPGSQRSTVYCLMESDGPAVRLYDPAVLPFATPAVDLPPRGDANQPRDVTFEGGLVLEVTPSLVFTGASTGYANLGGRPVPGDSVGLCENYRSFDGLYAFYPEVSHVAAPGFALRSVPNTAGLASGTQVEFHVLGGLGCTLLDGTPVAEGTWMKFGEGSVSEDGETIVPEAGAALPCLTWLGYRSKG